MLRIKFSASKSATLLAPQRGGGFTASCTQSLRELRTTDGFAKFRHRASSVETSQSRRRVSGKAKDTTKTNISARNKHQMEIQTLEQGDINLITELQPTDWQNIMPTIEFYTTSSFCSPIKVIIDEKIVGIGTTIIRDDVAWLAHIIVHPEHRRQGIGKLITTALVESLKSKNCNTIYLIATDLGEPIYNKVGFETETKYLFFKNVKKTEPVLISNNVVPFSSDFKHQVINLDLEVSKEDRAFQLEEHLLNGFVFLVNKRVEGFYLPTFGEGLIIASTNSAGQELMKLRLTTKENAVFPADNVCATEFMYRNNFKEFKTAKRMRLGEKRSWLPSNIYNRIGGNFG